MTAAKHRYCGNCALADGHDGPCNDDPTGYGLITAICDHVKPSGQGGITGIDKARDAILAAGWIQPPDGASAVTS